MIPFATLVQFCDVKTEYKYMQLYCKRRMAIKPGKILCSVFFLSLTEDKPPSLDFDRATNHP